MGPEFEPWLRHTVAMRNWTMHVTKLNFGFLIRKQNKEKVGSALWAGGER